MLKKPTNIEIEKLKLDCTWMGGDPAALEALLNEFEFEIKDIKEAITNVMNSHSCNSTYHSALSCKRLLESKL